MWQPIGIQTSEAATVGIVRSAAPADLIKQCYHCLCIFPLDNSTTTHYVARIAYIILNTYCKYMYHHLF
jgi:hypothetical protein